MLKFSEFLNEETEEVIPTDEQLLRKNLDAFNGELDALTEKPYQNAPIFLAQLRGVLERYGMNLPQKATTNFLNLSAELVYALGNSQLYLYIVYDTNEDGYVDGYAQVVNNDELKDLTNMDANDLLNTDRDLISVRHSDWYRKRDDDAGNSDEY